MEPTRQPYALTPGAGETIWFWGAPTRVLARAEQTGGAFGLVEHVISVGDESPWHVHHTEDEAFYVAEGEVTFRVGDQITHAGPGAFLFGPRGIPHGFRVGGSQPARLLLLFSPGGFEQFITGMSESTPSADPPDMQKMMALAAKHSTEIFGPWPE